MVDSEPSHSGAYFSLVMIRKNRTRLLFHPGVSLIAAPNTRLRVVLRGLGLGPPPLERAVASSVFSYHDEFSLARQKIWVHRVLRVPAGAYEVLNLYHIIKH